MKTLLLMVFSLTAASVANARCNFYDPDGSVAQGHDAADVLGHNPAQIHARFASIIDENFRTGNPDRIMDSLTVKELSDLLIAYRAAGGRLLAPALQKRLTGDQWKEIHPAGGGGPSPTVGMTLYEIYLDFRTAPIGSLSVSGALYETASFAGSKLFGPYGAFTTGYALGTALSDLIQNYAPDLWVDIGEYVAADVDALSYGLDDEPLTQAPTTGMDIHFQESENDVFFNPYPFTGYGDFYVTQLMATANAGGC